METGDVFVVSAPSGAGKTTICRRLLERLGDLDLSVSYTTRPRKPGEVEGIDYYFVTPDIFDKMINSKAFLEYASVYGNRYGTSRDAVEATVSRGRDALLEIDVQGGRKVKEAVPGAVMVAIFPPGREEIERRLSGRGRDSREEMEERIREGTREVRELLSYDYLVVNDDLDSAVSRVEAIITAHRLRRERALRRMGRIITRIGEG